jgi:hypothetical protein
MKLSPLLLSAAALFLTLVHAHGPALSPAEFQKREQTHLQARRAFAQCQHSLSKRSVGLRREEFVRRHLEKKRGNIMGNREKEKRQNPTTTNSQKDIATGTNTASPFTGIPTCVLAPESVQGPYCSSPSPPPPPVVVLADEGRPPR